jgi:hypothetical protein
MSKKCRKNTGEMEKDHLELENICNQAGLVELQDYLIVIGKKPEDRYARIYNIGEIHFGKKYGHLPRNYNYYLKTITKKIEWTGFNTANNLKKLIKTKKNPEDMYPEKLLNVFDTNPENNFNDVEVINEKGEIEETIKNALQGMRVSGEKTMPIKKALKFLPLESKHRENTLKLLARFFPAEQLKNPRKLQPGDTGVIPKYYYDTIIKELKKIKPPISFTKAQIVDLVRELWRALPRKEKVKFSRKEYGMKNPSDVKPPKRWWYKMVKEIKEENPSYNIDQVKKTVGKIWYNRLSQEKRAEIIKREWK